MHSLIFLNYDGSSGFSFVPCYHSSLESFPSSPNERCALMFPVADIKLPLEFGISLMSIELKVNSLLCIVNELLVDCKVLDFFQALFQSLPLILDVIFLIELIVI